MRNLSRQRNIESTRSTSYSRKLRERFEELGIPLSRRTEGIPTDLGDIQAVANKYLQALEVLFSREARVSRRLVIRLFKNLHNDLYIHFAYHFKALQRPLNLLIDDLEDLEGRPKTRVGGE